VPGPIRQESCRNLLLQTLQPADFRLLAPHLSRVHLRLDEVLTPAGKRFHSVYFPEGGIITFSDEPRASASVGVGSIGCDGWVGWPVLLGVEHSPHEIKVTADGGTALQLRPEELRRACRLSDGLRDLLLRFVHVFTVQMGRTVISSLTQSVEDRLCRWALMAHDRVEGDEIKITHENVALMLAVRRASVTDALHVLEGEGLIRSRRGTVVIRDRDGLSRRAGDSYGFCEAEYSRLIAPFPRK
jgi:CRP-like cAMP-binding protein